MDTLTHEPASPGEGGWHLAPADHALVAAKSRVNRLRFAVMLLFFRDRGRFPRGADILDPEAMARLASALNVPLPPEPVAFDVGDRTLERQRSEIRALFDFREATVADAAALGTWLCDHAVAQSRDHDRLAAELEARCRTLRIEPPAPDRVERIVRGAVRAYEYRFTTGIHGRLATEVRDRLDALLRPAAAATLEDDETEVSDSRCSRPAELRTRRSRSGQRRQRDARA